MVSIMRDAVTPHNLQLSLNQADTQALSLEVSSRAPLQIPFWFMYEKLCLTVEIMPPGQASWMCLRLFWYKRHHLCYSSSSSLSGSWGPCPISETGHMEWARRVTAQGKAPTSSPNVPSSWAFPIGVHNRSSCTSTNRTPGQHTRRVFQDKSLVRSLWHAKSHTLVPLIGWLTWPTDSPNTDSHDSPKFLLFRSLIPLPGKSSCWGGADVQVTCYLGLCTGLWSGCQRHNPTQMAPSY